MRRSGSRFALVGAATVVLAATLLDASAASAAPRAGLALQRVTGAGAVPSRVVGGRAVVARTTTRVARLPALAVALPEFPVLTLPAGDGFRDSLTATVRSRTSGRVDLLAVHAARSVVVARQVRLTHTGSGYTAAVRVPVRLLPRGSWSVRVRRSTAPATTATAPRPLQVGSGVVRTVVVAPATRTLHPYRDGYQDVLRATVRGLDETATVVPVRGTLRLTSAGRSASTAVRATTTRLSAAGLPPGPALLQASVAGPAGGLHHSGLLHLTLARTAVASVSLAASATTVQPVVDDLADTVSFTVAGTTTIPAPVPVSGSVVVTHAGTAVRTWTLHTVSKRVVVWDGRVAGRVEPGTYRVTVRMRGPEGPAITRSTSVTVSADHLPYRTRTLFLLPKGNQQGLAVHDGRYYVATDVGGGTSQIDVYDATGTAVAHLGRQPIGHGAELAYSPATGLLYAANGGPSTDTSVVAIDPASGAVRDTLDLHALGPNGMVAADDDGHLLVFAGNEGGYAVSVVDPASHGVLGSAPVSIAGRPQGIDIVRGEVWIYTSLPDGNRITRFTRSGTADAPVLQPVTGDPGTIELAARGEGEGMAVMPAGSDASGGAASWSGVVVLGAHSPNRVAVLEAVPDE